MTEREVFTMKYVIVLGDGMADKPIDVLNGQTPLEYAKTPVMDEMAAKAEIGLTWTIPEGMKPGSDTANLAVLGYYPRKYYTGRSPLEALSIGVPMKDTDIALRCNLVTLSEEEPYAEKTILDHSSGEISTEEADVLIQAVKEAFENETFQFYTGTSYRHLLIWDRGAVLEFTQPHDVLGQVIGQYLPKQDIFRQMMEKSYTILNEHPINQKRAQQGLNKANSLWFWGAGTKPALSSFEEKTGKKGAMISAVDLLKGIAVGADMKVIEVPGANGSLHTNYEGKAQAAIDVLTKEDYDFVYIHLEAPDEMGHQGSVEKKVQSIEYLDERVIAPVKRGLEAAGVDFRMLVMPDHPTPIWCRTHTADPVPYMIYDSTTDLGQGLLYTEKDAEQSENREAEGYRLIEKLLQIR